MLMVIPIQAVISQKDLFDESGKVGVEIEVDDEMNVVAHKAVMIDMDAIERLIRIEQITKIRFFFVPFENRLPVITPTHNMHRENRRYQPGASRHGKPSLINNEKNSSFFSLEGAKSICGYE